MFLSFIQNKKFITNLFDSIPDLGEIEISEIRLLGGPYIEIDFISKLVPQKLPRKYLEGDYNSSFIKIRIVPVEDLVIRSWPALCFAHIEVSIKSNSKIFEIISRDGSKILTCLCEYIDLLEWIPGQIEE